MDALGEYAYGPRKLRILVVEDDPDCRNLVRRTLEVAGDVWTACDARHALELLHGDFVPDVVVTDLMMPEIDGVALCKRIRSDPRTQHIPVVMLTASGSSGDRVAAINARGRHYVTKPFKGADLVRKVRVAADAPPTILVVEDDDDLRRMLGLRLRELGRVVTAESAPAALRKLKDGTTPDVIVTDVMMPAMDGTDFCRLVGRIQRMHDVPVIMLSAKDSPEEIRAGLEAGARQYLTKPFNAGELLGAIRNEIARAKGERASPSTRRNVAARTRPSLALRPEAPRVMPVQDGMRSLHPSPTPVKDEPVRAFARDSEPPPSTVRAVNLRRRLLGKAARLAVSR